MTDALAVADPSHRYRRCVGVFPTGVTVVCARGPNGPAGMTLNSFTSVSLDPLLVLVSLARDSRTRAAVGASGRFAVSILAGHQRAVAEAFARRGAPFPVGLVHHADDGHVLVRDALAHLRCTVADRIEAGDHDLVLGEVVAFEQRDGAPLVFHQGTFGELRSHG